MSKISVTVFIEALKPEKTMSVYLKLFNVRTGVESHGFTILKKEGRKEAAMNI